jgi:hypothetical protein
MRVADENYTPVSVLIPLNGPLERDSQTTEPDVLQLPLQVV